MKNPLYSEYFADPFVLRHNGEYYAYGTPPSTGHGVPVLHSKDLVHWEPHGVALADLSNVWAPEVAYRDGIFFMYYSVGGPEGEGHQLRVATSSSPLGPFLPGLDVLTPDEAFSIDAHPFQDDDGTWYLFYCRDFLEGDRVGTGVVVDRLVAMNQLAGEPRVVVRPHADWQIYQRQRHWYDRLWEAWYTVEGPFVVKRNGKYYLFFSGGAWKEANYGLSWGVADHPLGPYTFEPSEGPSLLSTKPGEIIGPGHASILTGPDGVSQYICYHAWDPELKGRTMRIDRLHWDGDRPTCGGATLSEQPDPATAPELSPWRYSHNSWSVRGQQAAQTEPLAHSRARVTWGGEPLRAEVWMRAMSGHGRAGLLFGAQEVLVPVGYGLRHLVARLDNGQLSTWIDGVAQVPLQLDYVPEVGLVTADAAVAFTGLVFSPLPS